MWPAPLCWIIWTWAVPAIAAVTSTNTMSDFQRLRVGYPFDITWSGATGDVTISLLLSSGVPVAMIASEDRRTLDTARQQADLDVAALTSSPYSWTPPALSTTDSYVLQLVDSTQASSTSVGFDVTGDGVVVEAQAAHTSPVSSTATSSMSPATASPTSRSSSGAPPTMTTSVSSSRTATPLPSSTSGRSLTPTPVPPSQKSGALSAGAKAGISVGAVVGTLLIILLAALAFRTRRRAAARQAEGEGDDDARHASDRGQPATHPSGPEWEKGMFEPSSAGSKNSLLKKHDGRGSSRLDTLAASEGTTPTTDVVSASCDRTAAPLGAGGRTSQLSIHRDGRTSRIGRFEFEESPEPRGFSGGIRIVEMEDLKI
ncbi:hypothetical protein B2J93_2980 [Marssonina coronariae]|uniref:Uncharacterized protein n=1 Tax=Diplocarpon coronariae TaxID=2795749 RepID=A0A218Z5H9_9HELO|nr:hypothetical protein B2J93_2980 [Marssonina coronariae]